MGFLVAAGVGFEPTYIAPEAIVLPLDDPAIFAYNSHPNACNFILFNFYTFKYLRMAMRLEKMPRIIPVRS